MEDKRQKGQDMGKNVIYINQNLMRIYCFYRAYLEQFVDHLPLETEKKAYKVLQLCEHRSMTEQGM